MLALCMSLLASFIVILFVPSETFGSCFEGSCGYMALFIALPIMTLLLWPLWYQIDKRIKRPSHRLACWALVILPLTHLMSIPHLGWIVAAWIAYRLYRLLKNPLTTTPVSLVNTQSSTVQHIDKDSGV